MRDRLKERLHPGYFSSSFSFQISFSFSSINMDAREVARGHFFIFPVA